MVMPCLDSHRAHWQYSPCAHRIDFDDDSDIDVVYGDETITLHYEEDLDDLATVSVDRTGVPVNGQVHVTVSDFRLNLDPTGRRPMDHVCKWHSGRIC